MAICRPSVPNPGPTLASVEFVGAAKERRKAVRELTTRLRQESRRLIERSRDVADKGRNIKQVTINERLLRKLLKRKGGVTRG